MRNAAASSFKVIFIYPDICKGGQGKFYHGIGYLSASLKRNNYDTALIHLTKRTSKDEFLGILDSHGDFDLIAYTATTNMFPVVLEIAEWVHGKVSTPSVIGGIHATLSPQEVIDTGLFDIVCLGEGEEPLLELCQRLQSGLSYIDIRNLWVKNENGITKNGLRPLRSNLDELPFPDRDIMEYHDSVDVKLLRRGVFMASRGCPYECSFCCNHSLKHLYNTNSKSYVRFRSVPNLIEEITRVVSDYPSIDNVAFHDDILPLNKEWFYAFCREYEKSVKLPFQLNCRAELVNREMIQIAKTAGCRTVSIGIESGSEAVRGRVLNRHMSDAVVRNAFQLCDEMGIATSSYNMVGIPGETFQDMIKTLKLNASLNAGTSQYSIFYPYPGTALFEECRKKNLLSKKTSDSYLETTILNFGWFRRRQIETIAKHHSQVTKVYSAIFLIGKGRELSNKIFDVSLYITILFGVTRFILNVLSGCRKLRYINREDSPT